MASIWDEHQLEQRIREILKTVPHPTSPHLNRPFMTPYQIAIEYRRRHRDSFDAIGMPIGGAGTGGHNSFTQYLGGQLSVRFRDGDLPSIEGALFSDLHLEHLSFKFDGGSVQSSLVGAWNLSMFRFVE